MLGALPPARRRLVLGVLAAALALLLGVTVWLLLRPGTPEVDQSTAGPVVLVAGYGGDVAALDPVVAALEDAGRETAVLDQPGGGTGDLRVQARALRDLVDQVLDRSGAESVDLVGYSAGGVVARLYVRDEGGAGVVRRVLTIGSPHHGSEGAELALRAAGSCPEACEQLVPDSDLLRRLDAGDETPAGPLWATVRSAADRVVTPVDSAELDGATNVLVQDLSPEAATTHDQLPADPEPVGRHQRERRQRDQRDKADQPCRARTPRV